MYCGVPLRYCGLSTLLLWKYMADTELEDGNFELNDISVVTEKN